MTSNKFKVKGQWETYQNLLKLERGPRPPQSVLFYGRDSIGKRFLAQTFARFLNCLNPLENSFPCEECISCLRAKKNLHPDIHEIFPYGQTVSIEEVRMVTELASKFPQMKKVQVFLIDGMEHIQTAAANALLKILEEPPLGVRFFLISSSREKILKTILSRVTPIFCPPPKSSEMEAFAEELGVRSKETLTFLFERFSKNPGFLKMYWKAWGDQIPKRPEKLMEALEVYQQGLENFEQSVIGDLSHQSGFLSPIEMRTALTGSRIKFMIIPRFFLVESLFALESKPQKSTLFFLSGFLEEQWSSSKNRLKKSLGNLIEEKGKDQHEKSAGTEIKKIAQSLISGCYSRESEGILEDLLVLLHATALSPFKFPIGEGHPIPPVFFATNYDRSESMKLYWKTESCWKNLRKNGNESIQFSSLFPYFGG